MSRHSLPGLVDVHVHLRNPGGAHKETVASGTAAALAGGVTAVLGMPNTEPPITDGARLDEARAHHAAQACCDVGLFLGATAENAAACAAAAGRAAGLKIYLNDTFGPLRIERLVALREHVRRWRGERPIVLHAEDLNVATALGLARIYDQPVHIAHVSRAVEIELIADAKAAGLPVTCEVTPHHLLLCEEDVGRLGAFGDMRPTLASAADRAALWRHLDVIDCVATDHAPHTRAEKATANPPPGVPGLETTLPLLLTAVEEGRLSLERLVQLCSQTPARIFGVPTPAESVVEVEIGPAWQLPEHGYRTLVDWSPFAGREVRGRVHRVTLRGQAVWEEGRLLAEPGTGRLLYG